MLTQGEEDYLREKAYVPEHVVSLMVGISQAEPLYLEDYLLFRRDDWMILIGYPLAGKFEDGFFSSFVAKLERQFRPATLWFTAPRIPETLPFRVQQIEADEYYKLDLLRFGPRRSLQRDVEKAARLLRVEKNRHWSPEHESLTREFLEKENLPPRVRELYLRMPQVLAHSPTSLVLSARDASSNLCAFYVIELGALRFATYVVGCYSKKKYVSNASDLLFHEMVELARGMGKEYVHLGLGVNDGIRRFKKKWGGAPDLPYFAGEIQTLRKTLPAWLKALTARM